MVKVKEDLTGQQFGRLKVLYQIEDYIIPKTGAHSARWLCECNCSDHKKVEVTGCNLKNGNVQSCGCLARELSSERQKKNIKENQFDLESEDYGIGYTSKGEPFWFDKEDYDKIKNYCWFYSPDGYVVAKKRGTNTSVSLHVLLLSPIPKGMRVDHKRHPPRKGHKYDNRKSNLEIKTNSQNMMNASLYVNNSSGVAGVTFTKANNKWQVRIGVGNKRVHIGYFDTYEDAVKARKEAEEKYWGDYRYDACNA